MSLYGNYVPENIEMTYSKFQELEGKQKALQEEYEDKAKFMMSDYNLYDPNIKTLVTGYSLGEVIFSTWEHDLYDDVTSIFYDLVASVEKAIYMKKGKKVANDTDLVGNFVKCFSKSYDNDLAKSDAEEFCFGLDDWVEELKIEHDSQYFYVPDPLLLLQNTDNNDIKGLAEIIYEGGVKKVC
jgi:hypothetical protein